MYTFQVGMPFKQKNLKKFLWFINLSLGISSLSHIGNRVNHNALDEGSDSDKNRTSHGLNNIDLKKDKPRANNHGHIRPSSAEVLLD